jgi:hypothetical protein
MRTSSKLCLDTLSCAGRNEVCDEKTEVHYSFICVVLMLDYTNARRVFTRETTADCAARLRWLSSWLRTIAEETREGFTTSTSPVNQ